MICKLYNADGTPFMCNGKAVEIADLQLPLVRIPRIGPDGFYALTFRRKLSLDDCAIYVLINAEQLLAPGAE